MLPSGTSHQDESDDELDAHQDEDRTDPEITEEEGDIWCYISWSQLKGNTLVTRWSELYISYYKVMPLDTMRSGNNEKYNYI